MENQNKQLELAQAITSIQENMPALMLKVRIDAELHMNKYKSLIKQGFTESQALELCKIIY